MKNIRKMTNRELYSKIIENRAVLRTTKDTDTKRRMIAENHEILTELDRRYATN